MDLDWVDLDLVRRAEEPGSAARVVPIEGLLAELRRTSSPLLADAWKASFDKDLDILVRGVTRLLRRRTFVRADFVFYRSDPERLAELQAEVGRLDDAIRKLLASCRARPRPEEKKAR